jgi:hypothetical protein
MPRSSGALAAAHARPWLRAALALLAVSVVAPAAGDAPQSAVAEWIEIVRDDAAQLDVVLRAPAPVVDGNRVTVPGFAPVGAPGERLTYARSVLVAVPGPAGADLAFSAERGEPLPNVRAEIVPHPRSRAELDAAGAALPAPRAMPLLRTNAPPVVSISNVTRLRGLHVVELQFTPLVFDAAGNASFVAAASVRLTFRDRAPRHDATAVAAAAVDPVHAGVLNAATAAAWVGVDTGAWVDRLAAPRRSALPAERLRIRIPETGAYELRYTTLDAAGVPVDAVSFNPRTLRLFVDTWNPIPLLADSFSSWHPDYEMQEVAIWVDGEQDNAFDVQDRIVFYALGPQGYADLAAQSSDPFEHREHPYDANHYAWLVWGGTEFGLRMPTLAATASDPLVDPLVTSVEARRHLEENRLFRPLDDLWSWDEVDSVRAATASFNLDLGGPASTAGQIRVGVSATAYYHVHAFDVTFNGVTAPTSVWVQGETHPRNTHFSYDVTLRSTNNNLSIRSDPSLVLIDTTWVLPTGRTHFLYVDATWQRPLVAGTNTGTLEWSRTPDVPVEVFELTLQAAADSLVLNVTDPVRPVRLVNTTRVTGGPARLRVRHGAGIGVPTHYVAGKTRNVPQSDVVRRVVTDLRDRTGAPDMLIVTHPSLHAAADRLAAHRQPRLGLPGAEILVVDASDIYESFSGGRMDPLAIRNYLKFLYGLDPTPRLRYVLLFGEATHDPRRLSPGTTATLVPTLQPFYADQRLRRDYQENAVDDWLVEMDRPFGSFFTMYPLPDIAVGRITARTLAQADGIVSKIIAYDTSNEYGSWRTRVILSADDECKPDGYCYEAYHTVNTERLVPLTPPEWDIEKIYLCEFAKVLGQKPAARRQFISSWSAGAALVNYQGHGSPRQIADEVLFLGSDVPSLVNGSRLPVFTAFSCTVSEFDHTQLQSMAEDLLSSGRGGAIAVIGATRETFGTPNARINEEFWRRLFQDGATSAVGFGLALQAGKAAIPLPGGQNNEAYALLGDPAQTLLAPEGTVVFTSGHTLLEAGRTARVQGDVRLPGTTGPWTTFSGTADVEVFSSADTTGYVSAADPTFRIAYDLVGAPIYRGTVPVTNGTLAFEFVVPLGAPLGRAGRVSAYAYDPADDAKGAFSDVVIQVAAVPDSSVSLPQITLRFPNNLTKVKSGTPLTGEIRDENGINIQGTSLRSQILLDFDGANQPLDVTDEFRYEQGSATYGTVTVALPEDLRAGKHSATLIASDNLQNTATAAIEFEVVDPAVVQLVNVIAFPNPFKDRTHFFFEITDPARVVVRVFTNTGREVWRAEQDFPEPTQASIRWDGADRSADELANGTYIYRLEAFPHRSGAPRLEHVGKVVVMRD